MATILIVEDNHQLRRLYAKGLYQQGHDVLEADSIAQTNALLHKHAPDVILLDMGLPDGTGLDVLARLKKDVRYHHTEWIVISGQALYASQCRALGVEHYLEKPVTVGLIWDLVARLVLRKRAMIQ